MCPKRVEFKYKEGCARCDEQTRDMLTKFLETGKLEGEFAPRGTFYKNICYLNKTRQKVTRECCDRFVADEESYPVDFIYNNKIERYSVSLGMPMLVTQNLKTEFLFNMMELSIDHISDGNLLTIGGHTFEYRKFRQCFIPSFYSTVYKYQGADIDEHYNIYNVNRMDKKQLYTALSRTTKLEYIHLDNKSLCKRYLPHALPVMEILNSYFNSDYNRGKIYKITFKKNDRCYIGSTCQELKDRLRERITNNKSAVYEFGHDKPKLELITNAPSKDRNGRLVKVEIEFIRDYSIKYGDRLINKMAGVKKEREPAKFKAEIENDQQLQEKVKKLGITLRIKDDVVNKLLYIHGKVDGNRYRNVAKQCNNQKRKQGQS